MRIIYLSSNLSIHDHRFLKKLSDSDHEVFLITHYDGEKLPSYIQELKGINKIHYKNPLAFASGAEKYSIFTRKIRCWFAFLKSIFRLRRDMKKIKPDVIHAGWTQADGFMAALSGFRPLLLMPWGSDILIVPKKSRGMMLKTKYALSKADMITCDCENVKNRIIDYVNFPAEKIVVFPRGIDLKLFYSKRENNRIRERLGWAKNKILLMTRSFRPVYGVEYFLHALPKVVESCPETRVILCGDGPLKDDFEKIINSYKLKDHVHFAGFIKNEELPEYLNAADIYISSSLSDGTSLALLEAMASALPMVLSDVPSYLEWVVNNQNGYIVPRKNSQLLANRIIDLLKNDAKQKQFGEKNYQIAQERADWDKNFNKLEEMYVLLGAN
ncbi:MAG: glycosyltransferase family 4 protein [Candidatus Margulisiibacteriota bacterium]|nr:glycosyltransferase family 4 protein [Candidatus Margulisiibacteriota bacterium]